MAIVSWDSYVQTAIGANEIERCRRMQGTALEDQREILQRIFADLQPRRIACLGAGGLNDIPIGQFLMGGGEVYLVDWVSGISQQGFRAELIGRVDGQYNCTICDERCDPARFCTGFREPVRVSGTVCDSFELIERPYPHCAAYEPGLEPYFITADITQGRASAFARRAEKIVPSARTIEQSLQKGLSEVRRCASVQEEIEIPSGSIDLVTSSMVVSQFDHEPYTYFSKLLVDVFGTEQVLRKESKVLHLVHRLRGELFRVLMEGHAREMHRILDKVHGKAYLSVELFRSLPGERDSYFLVHEITQALDVLNEYFHFDFTPIPSEQALRKHAIGDGNSIILCLMMTPIAA